MSEGGDLSLVPPEARPYQGKPAGIVTRTAACAIDGLVVGALGLGSYAAFTAVVFVLDPARFEPPDTSLVWLGLGFLNVLILYLTAAWWLSGRTLGAHVMGVRVVTRGRRRLRLPWAFVRAVACALFPIGLLWSVVGPSRRSVQDLVLRTQVIHDWLPRPTADRARRHPDPGTSVPGPGPDAPQ